MPLPQPPRLEYPKNSKGMRPNTDEKKSVWVAFPHLFQQLLLPVVSRSRKLVPVFYEDGSIGMKAEDADTELAGMVDQFILSAAQQQAEAKQVVAAYGDFIRLVKALLLKNYDLKDQELLPLLTMTQQEFSVMGGIIIAHCMGS